MLKRLILGLLATLAFATTAVATGPFPATEVADPTVSTTTVYGSLTQPGQVDYYQFTAGKAMKLPIQVVVPVRYTNRDFRPAVAVVGPNLPGGGSVRVPFPAPPGLEVVTVPPHPGNDYFFEHATAESFYQGNTGTFELAAGQTYYVAVFDPALRTGDYVLGLGSPERISYDHIGSLAKRVIGLKFGLYPGREVPWPDVVGLFLLVSGLIIGLGAVTVMDTLGMLGRKSGYWTDLAIRIHRVPKWLIWAGAVLGLSGLALLYRRTGFNSVGTFQEFFFYVIAANGLFLSLYVSPRMKALAESKQSTQVLPKSLRRKVIASFVISFLAWWSEVLLLVWYVVVTR